MLAKNSGPKFCGLTAQTTKSASSTTCCKFCAMQMLGCEAEMDASAEVDTSYTVICSAG